MYEITPQENAFLQTMVDGICERYDQWLENDYLWPRTYQRKDEKTTVLLFSEYSRHLRGGYIEESIFNIFYWGGGDRAISHVAERNEFSAAIRVLNTLPHEHMDLGAILRMGNQPTNGISRIAFWSKVLAAYQPGVFFIYDSRVAIALSFISLVLDSTCYWIIPNDPGATINNKSFIRFEGMSIRNAIQANLNARQINIGADPNSCYHLYLELLNRLAERREIIEKYNRLSREIRSAYRRMFSFIEDPIEREKKSIMAHLEKMFFMMKETILI